MAYNDFLTEEERDELRKELEGLGRRKKVSEEDAEPEVSDSQILSDIIEETNSKLLSIEDFKRQHGCLALSCGARRGTGQLYHG